MENRNEQLLRTAEAIVEAKLTDEEFQQQVEAEAEAEMNRILSDKELHIYNLG